MIFKNNTLGILLSCPILTNSAITNLFLFTAAVLFIIIQNKISVVLYETTTFYINVTTNSSHKIFFNPLVLVHTVFSDQDRLLRTICIHIQPLLRFRK